MNKDFLKWRCLVCHRWVLIQLAISSNFIKCSFFFSAARSELREIVLGACAWHLSRSSSRGPADRHSEAIWNTCLVNIKEVTVSCKAVKALVALVLSWEFAFWKSKLTDLDNHCLCLVLLNSRWCTNLY